MEKPASVPIYDSSLNRHPAIDEFRELFRYWYLVVQMVRRDIVTRYKRSFLGVAWTMLAPLGTTVIMSIVFSQVFGQGGGYAGYVLSGLVPWVFFSQSTAGCMGGLLWGGSLLKRIYVPRTVFAISSIGTGLVNLVFAMVPLVLVMLASGVKIRATILLLPIPVLFLAMFTLGIGLLFSSIVLVFADVNEMYPILLTAWMYLSPIIYKVDKLPPQYLWFIRLNPLFYLISLFRAPIYDGRIPSLQEFALSGGISLVTLIIGWLVFTFRADEFAYRA